LHTRALLLYAPHMSNVAALYDAPDTPSALTRPLVLALVAAGFPSPADDHLDRDLDLHKLLIGSVANFPWLVISGMIGP
jgi:DNA polymerase V